MRDPMDTTGCRSVLIPTMAVMVALLAAAGCDTESHDPWKLNPERPGKSAAKTGDVAAKSPTTPAKTNDDRTVLVPKVDKSAPNKPPWDPNGLGEFQLTERSGRKITRADLLGKPVVVCFIFTHCASICTNVSGQMYLLQEWLKKEQLDVQLVSISVDPKRDTPKVLSRYADSFGADKHRWWFVTGEQQQLYKLIRKGFGQTVVDLTADNPKLGMEFNHSDAVMLVDSNAKVVAKYNATNPLSMEQLRERLSRWKTTGRLRNSGKTGKAASPAVTDEKLTR